MATGKKFAAFDIDGTLIRWQLYHAVVDSLAKLGYVSAVAYAQIEDARMNWKRRQYSESFKDYEHLLVEQYKRIIKQLSISQFQESVNLVFEEYKDQVYVYSRDLIQELKTQGYLLFAVSGSQHEIVEKIANYYDFDDFVGAQYLTQGDRFTGEAILTVGRKHEVISQLMKKHAVGISGSIALGDSAGDIEMLQMVEQPIVLNPDKKLFAVARTNAWKVVIERKNMVYEMEAKGGYYQLAKTNA